MCGPCVGQKFMSLHEAALAGDVRELTRILDSGVDVDTTNEFQSTALLYAAKAGRYGAAELLIARKASVDARNNSMTTALHCAASSGHLEICKLLLQKGADVRALDEDRDNALEMAKEEDQHDVCKYLEAAHAVLAERELREAMASGDAQAIGAAVDRAEEEGFLRSSLIVEAKKRLRPPQERRAAAPPPGFPPAAAAAAERQEAAKELAEARRALAAAEAKVAAKGRQAVVFAVAAAAILGLVAMLSGYSPQLPVGPLVGRHAVVPAMPHSSAHSTGPVKFPCMPNISMALSSSRRDRARASSLTSSPGIAWRSQQCEDRFFHDYFLREIQPSSKQHQRTYLELGANDGKEASNTHVLYEKFGWRGLLVEPTPRMCKKLANNRPADVVACGAVCDSSFGGKLEFITSVEGSFESEAGTLVGHAISMGASRRWSSHMGSYHQLQAVHVPCAPLGSLLSGSGLHYVDLFSLDVEQQELSVLKTIDLSKFRFAVAIVELECPWSKNEIGAQDKHVRALLRKHGYTYVMRQRGNDIWIDESVTWARRGATRAVAAARSGRMDPCMLDRLCLDVAYGQKASLSRWLFPG